MKKKVIIGLVATILSVGTISTSIALYTHFADDKTIGITGNVSSDGSYTLKLDSEQSTTLTPTSAYSAVYSLGFDPTLIGRESNYTQSISVAKVSIEFTLGSSEEQTDIENMYNALTISTSVSGYTEGTFYANETNAPKFELAYNTETKKYAASAELPFYNDGRNKLNISVSAKDDASFVDYIAEKAISYTVTVTDTTEFEYAYLVGGFSGWEEDDHYRMVPNLEAQNGVFEWMYLGTSFDGNYEIKAKKGDTWSNSNQNVVTGTTYNFYWNGSADSDMTIQDANTNEIL